MCELSFKMHPSNIGLHTDVLEVVYGGLSRSVKD